MKNAGADSLEPRFHAAFPLGKGCSRIHRVAESVRLMILGSSQPSKSYSLRPGIQSVRIHEKDKLRLLMAGRDALRVLAWVVQFMR